MNVDYIIMIGIKTADGKFFPILQEDERTQKRVILTTVRDDQPLVQIDLYQGKGEQMEAAQHVGRLRIEQVPPARKGEPDIELLLGTDPEGNLITKARVESPEVPTEEQSLIIHLNEPHLSAEEFAAGDFRVKNSELQEDETPSDSGKDVFFNSYATEEAERDNRKKHLLFLVGILAGISILILGYVLFFRTPSSPSEEASPPPTPVESSRSPAPAPPIQKEQETPKETSQVQKPASIGVWYSTVKGDNLWNLARSFYRNPWLYKKIAEENGITNPDLILQDVRLYIPDVETGR
ncbi:MAG: LysM peptidoglycan-binding domain-containing protein [Spirochaetales bacterium]